MQPGAEHNHLVSSAVRNDPREVVRDLKRARDGTGGIAKVRVLEGLSPFSTASAHTTPCSYERVIAA